MSETRPKHKVEFIESYWTGGEYGSNYEWSDNHGELVRCKDCRRKGTYNCPIYASAFGKFVLPDEWYCASGERTEAE